MTSDRIQEIRQRLEYGQECAKAVGSTVITADTFVQFKAQDITDLLAALSTAEAEQMIWPNCQTCNGPCIEGQRFATLGAPGGFLCAMCVATERQTKLATAEAEGRRQGIEQAIAEADTWGASGSAIADTLRQLLPVEQTETPR